MSERYIHIEKTFLYLLVISLFVHLLVGTGIYLMPPEKKKAPKQQTTMVELKDLEVPPKTAVVKAKPVPKPKPKPVPKPEPKPKPLPMPEPKPVPKVQPQLVKPIPLPVPKQVAPMPHPLPANRVSPPHKDDTARESARLPAKAAPSAPAKTQSAKSPSNLEPATSPGKPDSVLKAEKGGKDIPRGGGLLKRQKGETLELAKLFPTAKRMEGLEETYRKKYRDLEGGDTRMIDTKDPLIGTYSHRLYLAAQESFVFHTQSYQDGAGVGVVQVTIARDGSVEEVKILEPSNKPVLDKLLILSIRKMSYVGPLPAKWPYDKYKVIWTYIAYPDRPAPY